VTAPTTHESIAAAAPPLVGVEWIVEALGCDPVRLRDRAVLQALCERVLHELDLHAVESSHHAPRDVPHAEREDYTCSGQWHRFPHPGGVTGLYLLTESHLACHTYPEHALATFNLYCCRPRVRWNWEARLGESLGAKRVIVRSLERGNVPEREARS